MEDLKSKFKHDDLISGIKEFRNIDMKSGIPHQQRLKNLSQTHIVEGSSRVVHSQIGRVSRCIVETLIQSTGHISKQRLQRIQESGFIR